MTSALVQEHSRPVSPTPAPVPDVDAQARARDWAEIQERMLMPLYEAVYERMAVDGGTRMLALGCGAGLALLMASQHGAAVTGVDSESPELLAVARERLGADKGTRTHSGVQVLGRAAGEARDAAPFSLVTAFHPVGCLSGDRDGLVAELMNSLPLARQDASVVLSSWGPPERCATSSVMRVTTRLGEPRRDTEGTRAWRPAERDELEAVCAAAGLKPDGSGRVACPFGYADVDSAVRGLVSTGLFDAAAAATDDVQVDKELREALHPYVRRDGTVWMPNVFRYLIARPG